MHLLQHTFFWIFFGFGFLRRKKKIDKIQKKVGRRKRKILVEGGKKWKKRVRERTRLLSKAEK